MSDWETITPQKSNDGWETVSAPASSNAPKPIPPFGQRMASMGDAALKGFLMGGPIGMSASMTGEGLGQLDQATKHIAYTAGDKVTEWAAKTPLSAENAARIGFGTNIGIQAIPVVAGSLLGKLGGQPIMEAGAKRVMQSALKPSADAVVKGDAARAIDTMLKEGINVTPGGAAKLKANIDILNNRVADIIKNSPEAVNQGFPASELYKRLQIFRNQVNPTTDTETLLKAWNEFKSVFPTNIPIQQAQALKSGTYRMLEGKYGELGSADTEAQKALARGLRLGIEDKAPQVVPLNARASDLSNALGLVQRRSAVAGNNNIGGLAPLANGPAPAATFLLDRSSLFKSLLARGLYGMSGVAPTGLGGLLGGGIGAYMGQPPDEK